MTIDYQDIFERCMMESANLGRTAAEQASDAARAATDERTFSNQYVGRFNQLRIRESDRSLLLTFIREGAHLTESRLTGVLQQQGSYTAETVTWDLDNDERPPHPLFINSAAEELTGSTENEAEERQGLYGLIEDLLTAYALWRWLSDKLPDVAASYSIKWNDGIAHIKTEVCGLRLKKPKKQSGNCMRCLKILTSPTCLISQTSPTF